jgi:spore maturation protein CgeB
MRLLYVAMRHDYGKPEQGDSFEHVNFFDTLVRLASRTIYFDFPTVERNLGRVGMNRKLIEIARSEKPDLMFCVLAGDEISPTTLRAVRDAGVITLNWFCDDHWRFEGFTRRYAPCFDHVVTTAHSALEKYAAAGITNVIESQWACNPRRYPRLNLPPVCDVSFVGMAHGSRRQTIEQLRRAGVNVRVFGSGWDSGRLNHVQMVRLFNQSRINLNFAEASMPGHAGLVERAIESCVRRPMLQLPAVWRYAPRGIHAGLRPRQIKARTFEVPACGGFLLTQSAEHLDEFLLPGRDIAAFSRTDEIVDRVRHYLTHEDQRRAIAEEGCRRVLAEHTYEQRFAKIFRRIGLADAPSATRRAA